MYYECHVTIPTTENLFLVEQVGKDNDFKYSVIMNDEVYGVGPKAYLTRSLHDQLSLQTLMERVTDQLDFHEIKWIRRKIEQVILDERKE